MRRNIRGFGEYFLEEPLASSTKSHCCYWPCTVGTSFPAMPYMALASYIE